MRIPQAVLLGTLLVLSTSISRAEDRHWQIASRDPDRIFLTFHGDPATRRAVTWRTDTSVTNAVAEIAVAMGEPGFGRLALRVPAKTETVTLTPKRGEGRARVKYHSVVFTDLDPDTLHAYRVGDGKNRWSEWIQFRTATERPTPFKFIYFGDAQNDVHSRWSRVIRMANQVAPDAAFALHAGDLINRPNMDGEWAGWFKAGGFLHAQWTGIPVIGNHEYARTGPATNRVMNISTLWRPQFTLPIEKSLPRSIHETVYSVDYQGVRVIALNSCDEVAAQTAYLESELTRPGALWKIVTFHHPIFSPGARKNFAPKDRENWKALIAKHNVDLVLQGHDHTYARGQVPVINDGVATEAFQTFFVTSVSGPKQYVINEEHMRGYDDENYVSIREGENTQFFQVLEFGGNRVTYQAFTATGELYDEAVIEKNFATGEKKIIQRVPDTEERAYDNTIPYSKDDL